MYNFGNKLDQISNAPYYCTRTLLPAGITLTFTIWYSVSSGFFMFSLFSKLIIVLCGIISVALLGLGFANAHGNRLEIFQNGIVLHSSGAVKHISYSRIGRFDWSEHTIKSGFATRCTQTCRIIEKSTGICIARLSSAKYSQMGDKMSKLEHKLGI